MKYELVIHPRVTQEKAKIYVYRESDGKGSGEKFLNAVTECYSMIMAHPHRWQIRRGRIRHAHVEGFSYRLAFRIEGSRILILELRHTSRKPSRFGP